MTTTLPSSPSLHDRLRYTRPLKLAILLSVVGEAFILIVWGVILFPEGSLLHKFLWSVVFCGLGMGGAYGALLVLLVVDRLTGWKAVAASTALSVLLLGVACDALCLSLDRHFHYFGGDTHPALFLTCGVMLSAVGGLLVGYLSFTQSGAQVLERIGL